MMFLNQYGRSETIKVNDHVEFMSDLQTEKGPSAGTVIQVIQNIAKQVVIRHSDHPGETFIIEDLIIQKETMYKGGPEKLWILK